MTPTVIRDELINDAKNDNPVVGLTGVINLENRFKYRLSRTLGRTVTVTQADDQSLHIHVGSKTGSHPSCDGKMRGFILKLQDMLQTIARCSGEGPEKKKTSEDQWNLILEHSSTLLHDTTISLRETFNCHRDKYGALVTQMVGLDDVYGSGSSLDNNLGDFVVKLQQLANSYSGTVKQQNELVASAWTLLQRCPASDVRLRILLGSIFSNKLYELICKLSHPLNAHHTFIRSASSFPVFRTVTMHLGCPSPPARKAVSNPLKASTPPHLSQSNRFHKSASPPRNPTPPQCHYTLPKGTMMHTIRSYLPEEDRRLHLLKLQPPSKLAAALLIGCVLHGIPVPPGSDTYYTFGFSTCCNEEHVRELAGYYRQLLDTTLSPTVVFQGIMKALEHGTLPGLLRNKSHQNLDKNFPVLTQFLLMQPEKRFSVHRLIQFIRDEDNEEPFPCLKRDYGFKFCTQREQVAKLKVLYSNVIDKGGPGKLHYACTFGRLLDHAISTLGYVDLSMHRLLENDYPSPTVGYDNSRGLGNYLMPLFKRTKG